MQCTRSVPECNKEVTSDNGRTWLLNHVSKSEHDYSGLVKPCNVNHYKSCDKGIMKKTILQQESIFKDQVIELHRLYKRQRELMDDVKMRELPVHVSETKTTQFNPNASKRLSEAAQNTCQMPSLLLVNQACYWPSVLYAENFQALSSSVVQKSLQTGPNTSLNGSSHKSFKLLSSNSTKFVERTQDLQLPPDECIDSEGRKRFKEGNSFKVSEVPIHLPRQLPDICHRSDSKISLSLGKLNSSQGDSFGSLPKVQNTIHLTDSNKTIQRGKVEIYSSSHLGYDTSRTEKPQWKQEQSLTPNTAFQSLPKEFTFSTPINAIDACSTKIHLEQVESQQRLLYDTDEAGKSRSNLLTPHLKLVSPSVPASSEIVSQSSMMKFELSSVPVEEKDVHSSRSIPMAIQLLPCVFIPAPSSTKSAFSAGNSWLDENNAYPSSNSTCFPLFPSVGSLQYNLLPGLLDSSTSKIYHATEIFDPLNQNNDNAYTNKHVENSALMQSGTPKEFISSSDIGQWKHGNGDSSNYEMTDRSFENSHTNKLSAVAPKLHPNLLEDKVTVKKKETAVLGCELSRCPILAEKGSIGGGQVENEVDSKYLIDLNCSPDEDESAEVEMKSAEDVNWQPPVSPENKESSPPRGKSEEEQLEISTQSSEQEEGCPNEDIAMIAAEALVSISSAAFQLYLGNGANEPFETSRSCLQWFSEVVSSTEADSNHHEILFDKMKSSEATTLQVTETQTETHCRKSTGQKKKRTSVISLSSRAKRRQVRRKKSHKDFQGPALPCPASHITGRPKEAAGIYSGTTFARKKNSRNGSQREKKHANISTSIVMESPLCSLLKQQRDDTEMGFPEGCLTGWGKTNKRKRGQRSSACNPGVTHSRLN